MTNKALKINDIIFGEITVSEPVIIDLINSKPFQRLKGIECGGYARLYSNPQGLSLNNIKHSRYEHSVGVYYVLKKYGDSIEAQVSGLLHDVSHTAFSHGVDYILDEGCEKTQNFQDKHHEQIIKNSVIPDILDKYKLNTERIIHEANFPLLENDIPDVCADRIDYIFRNALIFRDYSKQEVDNLLEHLKVKDDKWYFSDVNHGQIFANLFKKMNDKYFSDPKAAILYRSISTIMRYAIDKGYLDRSDFFEDDKHVLDKIEDSLVKDQDLKKMYKMINDKGLYREASGENKDIEIYLKSRIVDPWVMDNDKLVRLSEVNEKWGKIVEEDLKPRRHYLEKIRNI
jgi:uncharacterized protein